jgi:uncharacterized lipoprotein YddW (UPF0748 family)
MVLRNNSRSKQQCQLYGKQHADEQLKQLLTGYAKQMGASVRIRIIVAGSAMLLGSRFAIATLINLLLLVPAVWANTATLGVVKTPDNEPYWSEITKRLQSTGIDYCIVDFSRVRQASDLGSSQLLFLPNIERLEVAQLAALQDWMRRGGRVVVSGPTGVLSQPEIRIRLRSLLGAYWAFALKKPSPLEPSRTNTQPWVRQAGQASNIWGGVVIPADFNSSTAAVWTQSDNSPAVVTTNQSTFFGWRWGINGVASPAVDSAWLRAVLGRYGLTPTQSRGKPNQSQQYCTPSPSSTVGQIPRLLPNLSQQAPATPKPPPTPSSVAQNDPDFGVAPVQVTPNTKGPLTTAQVSAMSRELRNLIGRFESALLAANAINTNVNLPTAATNDKLKVESTNLQPSNLQLATPEQQKAIAEARIGLQNFLSAAAQNDHNTARKQWLQARRTLWENYPTNRQIAQPEIRAIWLDRKTIVNAKSEQNLAKIFDQLAASGFNTVFFETVNASYPIYPSRVAPQQNPLVKGWDPLASAVKLAHQRGMELHAWVWVFAAGNQRHNAILNQPANYPGPVLKAHPDWAMFDKQGRLFAPSTKKAFLDPANPEVRRYITALLEEIVNRYQVDGIQLDYIRYPFQDPSANQSYGYGKAARQQFKEQTGYDPIRISPNQRDLWQKWTNFRIQQIDNFVTAVSQRLRKQRPSLILSAAVFPLPRSDRLQRLQQNWEAWAMRGDIDLVVPMTYALDTSGLENLAQPVLMQSTLSSALILPAIRLLNVPNIIAVDQIQLLRDLPVGGYALFAVENLDANLRGIFARTQGRSSSSTVEPVPYRQPFPAAAARYAALQREWSFLLASNQILIREPTLSEWGKQANTLSTLLNQLAAEPSMKNLMSAKTFLASFRSQFPRWMQSQMATQPYQVQAWDNRLATIERLLHYGERRAFNSERPMAAQP